MESSMLLLVSSLLVVAATAGSCPLTYEPVVDPRTGLPFYNDCLARLQLPSGTRLLRRSALEAVISGRQLKAATEPALAPSTQDYMRLLSPPAAAATDVVVDMATIIRFADDGFFYVGRPGFLEEAPTAKNTETSRGEAAPISVDGTRVSLRVSYPEGDMYMKIWRSEELQRMSASAADAEPLLEPSIPEAETTTDGAAASAAATGGIHRLSRRLALGNNASTAIRTEVTKMMYPYSAVSYMHRPSCSAALVGTTGRLVLTAGHCLYNFVPNTGVIKGYFLSDVSPGMYRSKNGSMRSPYGRHHGSLAEVMAEWLLKGNFNFDIGLLRLDYHYTKAGTLGLTNATCSQNDVPLTTAGYPLDMGANGSMWKQTFNSTIDTCSDIGTLKSMGYTYATGQDGSSIWTSDNAVHFVMSGTSAVPITPSYYNWILGFTLRNIINLPRVRLIAGPDMYLKCNLNTLLCVGTKKMAEGILLVAHPVGAARTWALRVSGRPLCLTVTNSTATPAAVNLAACNEDQQFKFNNTALWEAHPVESRYIMLSSVRYSSVHNSRWLRWRGVGVTPAADTMESCDKTAEDCAWRLVSVT